MLKKEISEKALKFMFDCLGYFNHYSYFSDKLWKHVSGFKNVDEAEVKCAFLSYWIKHSLGVTTYPCGMSWCVYNGDEEQFNNYINKWKPVFDDFIQWQIEQR